MTWLVSLYSIPSILYFYDKQSFYTQGLDCLPWILCRYPSCRCVAGMDNGSCGCFRAHCSCHSVLFYNIASASIVSETKKEMKANQSAVISYPEFVAPAGVPVAWTLHGACLFTIPVCRSKASVLPDSHAVRSRESSRISSRNSSLWFPIMRSRRTTTRTVCP